MANIKLSTATHSSIPETSDWENDEDIEASLLELDPDCDAPTIEPSLSKVTVTKLSSLKHEPQDCSTPKYSVNEPLNEISNVLPSRRVSYELPVKKPISSSLESKEHHDNNIRFKKKRKFPGPAGTLPKLNRNVDLKCLKDEPVVPNCPEKESASSQSSQPVCVSSNAMWRKLTEDLEISHDHLRNHCIENALINASKKKLPDGKVPLLVVVIDNINKSFTDATVTVRDLTGSMPGVIHRLIVKKYHEELKIGSALILKQTAVFSPSPRRQYLNITPNNLLQIYSENEQSSDINSTVVNKLSVPIQTLLTQPVNCTSTHPQSNTVTPTRTPSLFTTPEQTTKIPPNCNKEYQRKITINSIPSLNKNSIGRPDTVQAPNTHLDQTVNTTVPKSTPTRLTNQAPQKCGDTSTRVAAVDTQQELFDDDDFGDLELDDL